jgi:hypothetical protein
MQHRRRSALTRALLPVFVLLTTSTACGSPRSASEARAPAPADDAGPHAVVPPPFATPHGTAVPIDVQRLEVQFDADVDAGRIAADATLTFSLLGDGLPLLDLWPDADALELDGMQLDAAQLERIRLPGPGDAGDTARILAVPLARGTTHALHVRYHLQDDAAVFDGGTVDFRLAMNDLGGRQYFLERYAPANFEFDQFPMRIGLRLHGATRAHALFANGAVKELEPGRAWTMDCPDYFTSSSPYLHVTAAPLHVERATYRGIERSFPVTVYGEDGDAAAAGLRSALATVAELEADYGPYAHAALLLYVSSALHDDGMEHAGAAITDLIALPHEVTHFWFGRGLMPATGNAGWLDEAVASWRDRGYPSRRPRTLPSPRHLGAASPYRRATDERSYDDGSALLAALDYTLKQSGHPTGLKPLLSHLYRTRTAPIAADALQRQSPVGADLFAAFVN